MNCERRAFSDFTCFGFSALRELHRERMIQEQNIFWLRELHRERKIQQPFRHSSSPVFGGL